MTIDNTIFGLKHNPTQRQAHKPKIRLNQILTITTRIVYKKGFIRKDSPAELTIDSTIFGSKHLGTQRQAHKREIRLNPILTTVLSSSSDEIPPQQFLEEFATALKEKNVGRIGKLFGRISIFRVIKLTVAIHPI